jgi:hypothetical protein
VLAELTPEEQSRYATMVATAWVPVEFATKLYVLAAPLLYPGDPTPVRHLGRDLADENLRGVYRFVVRFVSVPTLIEKSATLWRTFHEQGTAHCVRVSDHALRFEVEGYPELPERMRETISGWTARAVELTGAKNVRVVKSDNDPACWTWALNWR